LGAKEITMANKIYHLCFQENKVPGPLFSHHNDILLKEGAIASLKFRRGPLVDKKDIYLVFWIENNSTYFSRINTALYGLDWMFFKDGHEMVECKDWEELTGKLKEFNEKGYCHDK
jgi:hypothetical protein